MVLRKANGARLGALTQFTYAIADNDAPPALPYAGFASLASNANENDGTALIPVALSSAAPTPITVDYLLRPGTAQPDIDFVAQSGTLNFSPGDTVRNIAITLLDNQTFETSRSLTVELGPVAGGQPGT